MLWLFPFGNHAPMGDFFGGESPFRQLSIPAGGISNDVEQNDNALSWEAPMRGVPEVWLRLAFGVKIWRIEATVSGGGETYNISDTFQAGEWTDNTDGVKTTIGDKLDTMSDVMRYMESRSGVGLYQLYTWQENRSAAPEFCSLTLTPGRWAHFDPSEDVWYLDWFFGLTLRKVIDPDPFHPESFFGQAGNSGPMLDGPGTATYAGQERDIRIDSGLSLDLNLSVEEWMPE